MTGEEYSGGPPDVPTIKVMAQRAVTPPLVDGWAFQPDAMSPRRLELSLSTKTSIPRRSTMYDSTFGGLRLATSLFINSKREMVTSPSVVGTDTPSPESRRRTSTPRRMGSPMVTPPPCRRHTNLVCYSVSSIGSLSESSCSTMYTDKIKIFPLNCSNISHI